MAAAVAESISAPASSISLRPALTSRAPASVSLFASGGRTATLPEFSGLRISTRYQKITSGLRSPMVKGPRRGTVVCEAQEATIDVPDVSKDTWQSQVTEATRPVLVEFWAPWCGPCRMIHPVIGKLSKTYEGKLDCLKLNTDDNPDIATKYGIRSIPTIMIFKNGEKKDAIIGAVPESTLVTCIEKFLER